MYVCTDISIYYLSIYLVLLHNMNLLGDVKPALLVLCQTIDLNDFSRCPGVPIVLLTLNPCVASSDVETEAEGKLLNLWKVPKQRYWQKNCQKCALDLGSGSGREAEDLRWKRKGSKKPSLPHHCL